MNILIINGSPRAGGIIDTMARTALDNTSAKDTAEKYDLYDLDIKPCRGCMSCRSAGECSLPADDGHLLAEKFRAADMVIIGSPTYWSNMSGVVKNMFDRLVYVLIRDGKRIPRPLMEGRKAVIVTSCSAPAIANLVSGESRGTRKSIQKILKMAGYNIQAIEITGTKGMKALPKNYKLKLAAAMEIK